MCHHRQPTAARPARSVRYELTVDGLTCGGCADRVAAAIDRVGGVHGVDVDHEADRLEIEAEAPIRAAISEAGYTVRG